MWPTREQIEPFLGKSHDELIAGIETPIRDEDPSKSMERHLRFFCLLADCGVDRLHFLTVLASIIRTGKLGHWFSWFGVQSHWGIGSPVHCGIADECRSFRCTGRFRGERRGGWRSGADRPIPV